VKRKAEEVHDKKEYNDCCEHCESSIEDLTSKFLNRINPKEIKAFDQENLENLKNEKSG
jgi:hypothetical protein